MAHIWGPDQKQQVSMTKLCINNVGCTSDPELIKKFKNNTTSINLSLSTIYPIKINRYEIEPYAGCGPAIFIAVLKDTDNFLPSNQESCSTSIGLKAYGGINFAIGKNVGIFAEYQLNYYPVKTTYYNEKVVHSRTLGTTIGKETFVINTIVTGISYRL